MSTHHQPSGRQRLTGLVAVFGILALVAGLPAALLAVGTGPAELPPPDPGHLIPYLSAPDTGALALLALTIAAWGAWAVLTTSLLLEVTARVRRRRTPQLPGLAVPQALAHSLIGAAVLLVAAGPHAIAPSTASALAVATGGHGSRPTVDLGPQAAPKPLSLRVIEPDVAPESPTHTVTRGESLWSIAADEFDDGTRWREIADLNPGDSHGPEHILFSGTVLHLPTARTADSADTEYEVHPGDTLSSIAAERLADPGRWPEIYAASTVAVQPDGTRLRDPDLIRPGWTLNVPTRTAGPVSPTLPSPHEPGQRETGARPRPPLPAHDERRPPGPPAASEGTSQPGGAAPRGSAHSGLTAAPAVPAPVEPEAPTAAWLLAGLSGGGLLAGSLWLLLRRRRAAQSRHRRPGHTLASPPPALAPVEKSVATLGPTRHVDVEHLDLVLRHLAGAQAARQRPMPVLAAVELGAAGTRLHLERTADLAAPWQDERDGRQWLLPHGADPTDIGPLRADQPAPYPLLVTVGTTEATATWLYNLEDLTVALAGNPLYAADYARYLAAEIACNPWSDTVRLDCVGVATELVPMNPDRLRARPAGDREALGESTAHALASTQRTAAAGLDPVAARALDTGPDVWTARLVLMAASEDTPAEVGVLSDLITQHTGSTSSALVLLGAPPGAGMVTIELTAGGRARIPHAGLDLVAVGLTPDEAQGCAALVAAGAGLSDEPVPLQENETEGWRGVTDDGGALRPDLVARRTEPEGDDALASLLPDPDEDYLEAAATRSEDLAVLAPHVTPAARDRVASADPDLDSDLDAWFDEQCPLPRLTLLGPVRARTRGRALAERKAYMTSVLAYLATRPHGVTPDELAEAFGVSATKARVYAGVVREWLGTNPRTGQPHLPDARLAPAALTRGVPVYQVQDVLVDADLFRRLRARGQARGADGMEDLTRALDLVDGEPFAQLRPGAWTWLYDGDRLDQHLTCAVVDVAHLVATRALRDGDLETAALAAETAHRAAPSEHIPLLDLAAVADARGDHRARESALTSVLGADDEEPVPEDLPPRTEEILRRRGWTGGASAAS
ncbi:LysM peptidoglycan-binding domain-containing protein [Phycicoccus avicenniae]|uniref:LysM peptidoglycan-binding domain-containing protein n=1 Tax=Phycicoccus avicenniae TaxID=2828860 RepID=UPI003D26AE50